MKLFSKIAVVAAALMLVSIFTGCKNDSGSGPEIVAVFEGFTQSEHYACTLTCYDDESWDLDVSGTPIGGFTYAKGTYEGDPTKDGTFNYVIKQYVPTSDIYNGKTTLVTIPGSGEPGSTVISNGFCLIKTDMDTVALTRK